MRRILRFPVGLARFVRGFVSPPRKTGRIPLGRTTILIQVVAAAIFVGYTLNKKDIGLPLLTSSKYEVQVEFPDAKGLDPADSPAAAVAGTPEGQVTDVSYVNGRALVTLSLDSSVRGKLFADASAQLRPASALQNLLVNIDPGAPRPARCRTTGRSRRAGPPRSSPSTSSRASWTRTRRPTCRSSSRRRARRWAGEKASSAARFDDWPTSATLSGRSRTRLRSVGSCSPGCGDLNRVFSTLAQRGDQLAAVIDTANRTLAVTDARSAELAVATRRLAPVLVEAQQTLAALRRLAVPLAPALDTLTPASAPLANDLTKLRGLLPRVKGLVGTFKSLEARRRKAAVASAARDQRPLGEDPRPRANRTQARRLAGLLNRYKKGGAQLADTFSGAFSTQDRGGPLGQVSVLGSEPLDPADFGFPSKANGGPGRKVLDHDVALELERICRTQNPVACVLRFEIPGLPKRPLTAGGHG